MNKLQNEILFLSKKTGLSKFDCALILKATKANWMRCVQALRQTNNDVNEAIKLLTNKPQ